MEEIARGVYVETDYDGVNVGVIAAADGLVCIDAPSYPRDTRHWATQVDRINSRVPRYLVLTDCQGDRVINARWLNAPVITHELTAERLSSFDKRYPQTLLDGLYSRYAQDGKELTNGPVERPALSFSRQMSLVLGDVEVVLLHRPGPMPGSIWVHLPELGVLFAGDTVVTDTFPITAELSLADWRATLDLLADPAFSVEHLVPGRGPRGGKECASGLHAILRDFEDTVAQHIALELPRDQLADSVPLLFERYGALASGREWLQKQVRVGLERVYDELLAPAGGMPAASQSANGQL
jgi:glyoxylase-like metal-dependent hydrolase (beta-lactamase superfamily II)